LCAGVPEDPPDTRHTTEGKVIGDARARIGEKVDGSDAGELEVIGPELFLGYLDPADNESAFTADGWFKTGDLATISSSGNITIKGRIKDLIVRGGENISAKEVEDLILAMPGVDDVALVGVPDRSLGERAAAVVVGTSDVVSLPEITAHLRTAGIARQKFPEIVLNVRSLPRTASGKIQKFLVREQVLAAMAAGDVENRNADLPG
jgi:cyclohexanecarboxylate-CoA ligase